jgi:hypothetical protein
LLNRYLIPIILRLKYDSVTSIKINPKLLLWRNQDPNKRIRHFIHSNRCYLFHCQTEKSEMFQFSTQRITALIFFHWKCWSYLL